VILPERRTAVEYTFAGIEDYSCLVFVWEKAESEVEELKQVLVSSELAVSVMSDSVNYQT